MAEQILIINPGSTSTKIAFYDGGRECFSQNIQHPQEELMQFDEIPDQADYRLAAIRAAISSHGVQVSQLDIVMGRGGMFPPVRGGAYLVDDQMVELIRHGDIEQHASNLGGLLAKCIAYEAGVRAFVYDCVSVDEFPPICKITGIP